MTSPDPSPPRRALVVGLGLIGSSVALGLRESGWHVTGRDVSSEREQRALQLGVVDATGEDQDASFGVVATPVGVIAPNVLEIFDRSRNAGLVVTDVGSVKASVVVAVKHERFVGGHPMAGSEQEGPDGADRDLFAGANWVLTPTSTTDPAAFSLVRSIVTTFGAEPIALSPERHDALVALVSHVPHLVAATLMAVAAERGEEQGVLLRLAAGGFRDMTRIAAGDATMWPDVFTNNTTAILEAFDAVREQLDVARAIVADGDRASILELLEYAKTARRNLPQRIARPETVVECRIPLRDRPGELAKVTTILGESGVNIGDFEIAHSFEGDLGVLIISIEKAEAATARAALREHGYRPSVPTRP
ncbi:MAG TPA: prephenate dehydrogenase [Acidimicrobiales bacterium]|nr:prephenate dehydrogenase [Acidimicrobiales bacterium]